MMDGGFQTEELLLTGCTDPVYVSIIPPQGTFYRESCASLHFLQYCPSFDLADNALGLVPPKLENTSS